MKKFRCYMGSAQRLGPVFRTWAQPNSKHTQAPKEIQVVTLSRP